MMAELILMLFLCAYWVLIVGVPVWLVLCILKIIKRKNPSGSLSTAFKIVSIIILIDLPIWIFFFVLATSTMTMM